MKRCTKCGNDKPLCDFHKRSQSRDGLSSWCKPCARTANNERRKLNVERERERTKRWHAANREVSRARANEHYHNNKDRHRDKRMQRKYGIGIEDYDALLLLQGGKCAICGRAQPTRGDHRFQVDHDHGTGEVRGLLCAPCNTVLGFLEDDTNAIRSALSYLANPPARCLERRGADA